jgi:hypothetical protein
MVKVMSLSHRIGSSIGIGLVMSVSVWWSPSHAGTIGEGPSAIGSATSNPMTSSTLTATEAATRPMLPAAVPVENGLVLRTIPTVSKPISVGGTTLMPYIGAGFGGGYATEFDRSLNTLQSASSGSFSGGQKNFLGQQLIPNEVQLGIRFPF